jgi:hypothetical protein
VVKDPKYKGLKSNAVILYVIFPTLLIVYVVFQALEYQKPVLSTSTAVVFDSSLISFDFKASCLETSGCVVIPAKVDTATSTMGDFDVSGLMKVAYKAEFTLRNIVVKPLSQLVSSKYNGKEGAKGAIAAVYPQTLYKVVKKSRYSGCGFKYENGNRGAAFYLPYDSTLPNCTATVTTGCSISANSCTQEICTAAYASFSKTSICPSSALQYTRDTYFFRSFSLADNG